MSIQSICLMWTYPYVNNLPNVSTFFKKFPTGHMWSFINLGPIWPKLSPKFDFKMKKLNEITSRWPKFSLQKWKMYQKRQNLPKKAQNWTKQQTCLMWSTCLMWTHFWENFCVHICIGYCTIIINREKLEPSCLV